MNKYIFNNLLLFFLFLLMVGQAHAQEWKRELYFRKLNTEEGLSNPRVTSIRQDSRGYMWFGTVDGLNRYDGNEFKVYLADEEDSSSIPSNWIQVLYEDSINNLWIGTAEGLCRYNFKSEQFKNFRSEDGFYTVHDISHDQKNNRIWIASSVTGLKYLDLNSGVVKSFPHEMLPNYKIVRLLNIENNELYIATTNNGILKLNLDSFTVEKFCTIENGLFPIEQDWITALRYYDGKLLIGTFNKGLIVYDLKDSLVVKYTPQNSLIPSLVISAITRDQLGDIYIGTKNGIAIFNPHEGIVSVQQEEEGSLSSLSSNNIDELFFDKENNLWVAGQDGGIDFMSRESENMTRVHAKLTDHNSLSGNKITCFAQDDKGGIWIGTQDNGLNYYKNGHYYTYKADGTKSSLQDNEVTDICIDRHGAVWVSTLIGGLSVFREGKFVHIPQYSVNSWSESIRELQFDSGGLLWLATSEGLDSYDVENNEVTHYFLAEDNEIVRNRKNIRTVLIDREGTIFAGTSTGLYVYNPESGKVDYYKRKLDDPNSIGNNIVIEIFEDTKGRIWLGSTTGGLMLFDKKSKTFTNYNPQNGFPVSLVASIEEDTEGNLWIGSNKGLIKFSPSTEKSLIFGKSYGLQNLQFNRRASLTCDDGRLIFGGIKGFNVFRPKDLVINDNPLNVIISDLKIVDQSVRVFDETEILNQNIGLTDDLEMSYEQAKHFSLYFSAMSYSNPNHVQYAYQLEGFDEKWNFIKNETKVTFTNLEPGKYTFKIKASDNGVWKNQEKQLLIKIRAPWYMTIWFKISIILFVIASGFGFYFNKDYAHKKRQRILERLVNEKNYEISCQNEELLTSNDELYAQKEEVINQKDQIDRQNKDLTKAHKELSNIHKELTSTHKELKKVNNTLEEMVDIRTKELKESNIKLGKTVMELDRFVYSASHDLSAPLKSVLGLVNIAKLESKEKNLEIHLNYIEQSIKKQEKVIKSLIQYSRNSRLAVKIESLNLSDLVNDIISELRYMPGSEFVVMTNEIPWDTIVKSDIQRLQTILINMLSNGINYRNKEINDSFVKIHFSQNDRSWQLKVEDNGQGIANEQQDKIFQMFHRASNDSEGSGLGLFIVREAVNNLGGTISLESSLKQGAMFLLNFPIG